MRIFKLLRDFVYQNLFFSIFLTAFVAVLCFMPSERLPEGNDKTAHFLAFGILSFSWLMNFPKSLKAGFWLCGFAVFIEVVQYLLPESFHRGFDLMDIMADVIGILIGFIVATIFQRLVK
jgi:VanZ family protein